jgi:hypothetical protein
MEYRINSRIISVTTSYRDVERGDRLSIELEFSGARNHSKAWNVSCGVLGASGDWNLDGCTLAENLFKDSVLNCLCSSSGTFAAFITTRAEKVSNEKSDLLFPAYRLQFIITSAPEFLRESSYSNEILSLDYCGDIYVTFIINHIIFFV